VRDGRAESRQKEKAEYVQNLASGEIPPEAEIFDPAPQPLPALRASARLSPQVPVVPALFPLAGAARRDPRSAQIELVMAGKESKGNA